MHIHKLDSKGFRHQEIADSGEEEATNCGIPPAEGPETWINRVRELHGRFVHDIRQQSESEERGLTR